MTIVLASASPRRRDLLEAAGFPCEVRPMDVDERRLPAESPAEYVQRVASLKADAARHLHASAVIVAADTTVLLESDVFGKPRDTADAERMLRALAGRAHEVMTGVALRAHGRELNFVETTRVWMHELSDADIAWYVATGEPMDKAGAYAVQGLASRFVSRIEGSYSNVVGLPVASVARGLVALSGRDRVIQEAESVPPAVARS